MALSGLAWQAGLRHGMRRAGATAVAPQISLLERDPVREKTVFDSLAMSLLQFTPELAYAGEHSFYLNVSASLRLFGGVLKLCRQLRHCVEQQGFSLQIGMAPTAEAAGMLARLQPARRLLRLSRLQPLLDRLPVVMLSAAAPYLDWLASIGCNTLGELRALPGAGLRRRTDGRLMLQLQQAYGEALQLHQWIEAPPAFHMRCETHGRIEYCAGLQFYVERLLQQLCGWLNVRQQALREFEIRFEHERGRVACEPTLLTVRLADPVWQVAHLRRLLKERLARLSLPASVIAVQMEALQLAARPAVSHSLLPEPGGQPGDFQRLLELLSARLGKACLLQAAGRADHRPAFANHWHSIASQSGNPAAAVAAPALPRRPFWLLPKALPLTVSRHRPVYRSVLRLIEGPERIEAGWWDGELEEKDYFVGLAEDGCRYWIYRERSSHRWFLHGLFA